MNFNLLRERLINKLNNNESSYKRDLALQIGQMLVEARILKGVTQSQLAVKANIKQANISRAESGTYLPTLPYLQKIADAYNTYLIPPRFEFMNEDMPVFHSTLARSNQCSFNMASIDADTELYLTTISGHGTHGSEAQYYKFAN